MGAWLKKRRAWLIGGLAVVLVAAVAVYWFAIRPQAASAQDSATSRTVTASLQTMEKTVSTSGTVTPSVNETVTFAATGTVTSVDVAVGDTVKEGQKLATIDTLQLQVSKAQAKSDLETSKALLAQAKSSSSGTSQDKAQISSYEAQVAANKQKYNQAVASMDNATLTAPAAGQVTSVGYEVGDQVTGSSSSANASGGNGASGSGGTGGTGGTGSGADSGTTTGIVIVGTSAWKVTGSLDASAYANVKSGLQAEITLSDTSQELFGVVESVDLVPDTSSGVAQYPVTIKVTGTPDGLHDGMSADVAIVYERRTDVLAVPALAITMTNGQATVNKVGTDGTAVATNVTTGETSGQYTEITEGLAEGDTVQVTVVTQSNSDRSGSGSGNREGGSGADGEFFRDGQGGQLPGGEMPGGGQMPAPPQMGGAG